MFGSAPAQHATTSAVAQQHGMPCCCCAADSFEKAVLANTNAGGENCHRGAALGGLMGAALGEAAIPRHLIEVRAQCHVVRARLYLGRGLSREL